MFSFIEITNREENMPGWRGTILRIDLTAEKITKQPLGRLVAKNFIVSAPFSRCRHSGLAQHHIYGYASLHPNSSP